VAGLAQTVWQKAGVAHEGLWSRGEFWRETLLQGSGPFGWDGPWRLNKLTGCLRVHTMYLPVLFDLTEVLSPYEMDVAIEGQSHDAWSDETAAVIANALEEQIKKASTERLIEYAEHYWYARALSKEPS
jgi:hypothetical protein